MSDTAANLRRKIDSAGDLQSVVRTMKALAAANIGQYEKSVLALADYYRTVELGLSVCFQDGKSELLTKVRNGRTTRKVIGAVVFGSDQGLVGRFNETTAEFAIRTLAEHPGDVRVWAVGDRIHSCLSDSGLPPRRLFSVPGSVEAITPLVGRILVEIEAVRDEAAELHLFYNRPISRAAYAPVHQRLLPLDEHWRRELAQTAWPTKLRPEVIGDPTAALRALIRGYLFISLFRSCAESLASENASRLAAMDRAERNTNDLLESLRTTSSRLRQTSIDEELFDVVSGYEAMAG